MLSRSVPYGEGMRRFIRIVTAALMLFGVTACYRLPLRIRENDASGYEDVGIAVIEAVEYTPNGRDLRVSLESAGYVTVIVVDPDRGASVRFRRGELQSQFSEKGVHRYPLDRLSSPLLLSDMLPMRHSASRALALPVARPRRLQMDAFDAPPVYADTVREESARHELALASRTVRPGSGPVTAAHVVVLITERPLDLIAVATRLARSSLDLAQVAQNAADVIEGGRWMASMAPLRGQ